MSANNPETETIQVIAVQKGTYRDIPRKAGDKFLLVPIRMSTGKILTAKEQLSLDRDIEIRDPRTGKKIKQHFSGWMKVVGPGAPAAPEKPKVAKQTEAITEQSDSSGLEQGTLPAPELDANEKLESGDPEDEREVI